MTFVGGNDPASHAALRAISKSLRTRGASADDAVAEFARQGHKFSQVEDLPSGENHAPSLDTSSLPPNESAGVPALFRHITQDIESLRWRIFLPVENHAPSLDTSSLPPNESAGAPALSRRAILGGTVFAVLTLVALATAGHTLGISDDFQKLYSSLSKVASIALSIRANEEVHSIDNSAVAAKAGSVFEREPADRVNTEAATRKELAVPKASRGE